MLYPEKLKDNEYIRMIALRRDKDGNVGKGDGDREILLFGKLNDAFSVTLNVAILCWNYTDAADYIKPDGHFI